MKTAEIEIGYHYPYVYAEIQGLTSSKGDNVEDALRNFLRSIRDKCPNICQNCLSNDTDYKTEVSDNMQFSVIKCRKCGTKRVDGVYKFTELK